MNRQLASHPPRSRLAAEEEVEMVGQGARVGGCAVNKGGGAGSEHRHAEHVESGGAGDYAAELPATQRNRSPRQCDILTGVGGTADLRQRGRVVRRRAGGSPAFPASSALPAQTCQASADEPVMD